MSETILIAGAGVSGLFAAMALAGEGRAITVLDRDPPPPQGSADSAFAEWSRRGATQLRHSHVFLGRLVKLIKERHPRLWAMLMESGAREFTFEDSLPPTLKAQYRFQAGDEDLSILFARRTTLELMMRRYAESLAGVTFRPNALVSGLLYRQAPEGLIVEGLKVRLDGEAAEQELHADSVIDALGRHGPMSGWLREAGVEIPEDESPAGILYFTRNYRLRDGQDEPERGIVPGAGDLGFIKYGVFAADNRCFSITLACPEIETDLRVAINQPHVFDAICASLPGCARWTDPARAEPVSKVYAMGNLKNAWRSFVKDGAPVARGYYPVGDAALRTNPLYGRGCSTGAIQAHLLADIFAETADPVARMVRLDQRVRAEIRPFFDAMAKQDATAVRRAVQAQDPAYKPKFKAKLMKSFVEDAVGPATRGDLAVLRALMRPFHMHEHPTAWTKRLSVVGPILAAWATPKPLKAKLYAPPLGPERAQFLAQIGLKAA